MRNDIRLTTEDVQIKQENPLDLQYQRNSSVNYERCSLGYKNRDTPPSAIINKIILYVKGNVKPL